MCMFFFSSCAVLCREKFIDTENGERQTYFLINLHSRIMSVSYHRLDFVVFAETSVHNAQYIKYLTLALTPV